MKKTLLLAFAFCFMVLVATSSYAADKFITISTTTSTENTGLLANILPMFTKDTGIEVRVIAKGTGAAIKDGMDGNVDAIFVHDTAREEDFVKQGYGTKRYYVMFNDFVILGTEKDPAKVKATKTPEEALTAIASAKVPFISRGDDSGTHSKEAQIWAKTQVPLTGKYPSDLSWYFSIGQGMGKTIIMADEKEAYTIADRGTYYSMKYAEPATTELVIVNEGTGGLLNPYGFIPVNPEKIKTAKYEMAQQLADWLISEKGQQAIVDFKAQGKQLFFLPKKS